MSYKKGDKIVVNVSDISNDGYYKIGSNDFGIWLRCSDLEKLSVAGYTELLETKITNQAAEITKLISQNKSLKDKIQELILEKSQLIEMYDKLSSSRLKQIHDNVGQDRNIDDALIQGQNEAWELARKIAVVPKKGGCTGRELIEIFNTSTISEILYEHTYPEAAAKVEAWEKATIRLGDEVERNDGGDDKFIVSLIRNGRISGITQNGNVFNDHLVEYWHKTGRHIDIEGLLNQIGEE